MRPATKEAYDLLHEGARTLAHIESNGMRVDVDYLKETRKKLQKDITNLEERLRSDPTFSTWRRSFGQKTNINSREQLGHVLYEVMQYPCKSFTKTGRPKTDESAFELIDLPFIRDYTRLSRLKKLESTYLSGLERHSCDGLVHPFFNLNTVVTYRSSSDKPNFQNLPIRDPEMGSLIRRAFIPRKDHVIVEIDFSGIEVRIAACYHKDPRMLEYIEDPTKDMHRDMAAQCYCIEPGEVTKQARYCGKNMFVFPQFYGDYYINCATSMWEAIDRMHLTTASGLPLKEHLKGLGIRKLGACDPKLHPIPKTFEHHIKRVEKDFWGKRFAVYSKWKDDWYKSYRRNAGFHTLTGFRIEGLFKKNDVINYPVQGSAFHCLLWSLIQLDHWLLRKKMRSMLVGQIHDSIVADVHKDEVVPFVRMAKKIMTEKLLEHWKWIIVPIEVEVEASGLGETWYDKKPLAI